MSGKIIINSDVQSFLYSSKEATGEVDKRISKAIKIIKSSADQGDRISLRKELSSLKIDILAKLSEASEAQKFKVIKDIIQQLKETNSADHLSGVYQELITCFLENPNS